MRDKKFKYPKEQTIHGIAVRQRLRFTWQSYADFACIATDLLEDISRVIIWSITGIYAIWHVVANLMWSRQLASKVSLTTVLWGLLVYACISMLPRRYWLAQIVWHGGLVLIITLAVVLYQQPEISLLFILLPLTAVVTMGWPGGLVMEGVILFFSVYLSRSLAFTGLALPESFGILTVVGGAIAGILGWTSTYPLYMLTQQVLSSFTQAQRNMEDAREHRAHLANMLKNMDQAYYELQRSNAALVAARQEAEQAERFKAEFVTNVSHELRTPLNLIVGFSEVMMTSPESYNGIPLSGPYRSDLNAIYRSAQHLLALVDDVLDLARLEVGKMSLAREEVDIAMLVTDATNTVQSYITTKGLDLRTNIEDDLPLLWIDRLRIRQVLLNLLVNAARFTYQGYIGVEVHRQGDEVVLRITDTGQGISEQDLPKIFEEFRSTDQPLSTWHSGTGLGLPISKKFIELHRGRMGVESTYKIGTTFWFTLPCTLPPTNEQRSGPVGRWKPIVRLGDSERILVVVHEDKSIATLSKRYLEGYQVIAVTTIEEGIALAEKTKAIALLIGNIDAPAVDYGNLVVIHCPLPNRFQTAAALGARDMLVKPVSRHELLTAIQRLGRPIQRVLLVDDDPQVAQLFRRMMRTTALIEEYIEAYNGAEALSLMRSEKPDLVLLDLMMPEVDGRSVTDQMAEDSSLRDIPVIIVSAKGHDYVNFSVSGSIEIYRPDGFQFSEVMQTIEATLSALTPGWDHLDFMGREHAKETVEKPASEDSPKPPMSGLNLVH